MTRSCVLALLLAACGGGRPQPAPIGNTTTSSGSPGKTGKARVDLRTQDGGAITLLGDREAAMEEASREMAAHCGEGAYMITQEGEEVDAQWTEPVWRVFYQCSSGALMPP